VEKTRIQHPSLRERGEKEGGKRGRRVLLPVAMSEECGGFSYTLRCLERKKGEKGRTSDSSPSTSGRRGEEAGGEKRAIERAGV